MKDSIQIKYTLLIMLVLLMVSCSRADENDDVLAQEEISSMILNVRDELTGVSQSYTYVVNSANTPVIKLEDGKSYIVSVVFRNGSEDITQEIIDERDEHFLIFSFSDSDITVTRTDNEVRNDGKRLGILTNWQVNDAVTGTSSQLNLKLIHDALSVDESQDGTSWGSVTGGETDALAVFGISD
jgi:hypothetical protein